MDSKDNQDPATRPDSQPQGRSLTDEEKERIAKQAKAMRDALDSTKTAPKSPLDNVIGKDSPKTGNAQGSVKADSDKGQQGGRSRSNDPDVESLPIRRQRAAGLSREEANRRVVLDRKYLEDHVRANGNMSVARRTAVVGSALRKLGYRGDQAKIIALDAPLNAGMYNDGAVRTALEYAESISDVPSGKSGQIISKALQSETIPMPSAARKALDDSRRLERTPGDKTKSIAQQRFGAFKTLLDRTAKPVADRMSNLPVPGGIGGLLAINLLFLAAIVPVHAQGYTRLELLWLTLLNRTRLPEQIDKQTVPADPLVQGVMKGAEAVDNAAIAIGSLGQQAQNIANIVQAPGLAIQNGVNIAATTAYSNPSIGGTYVPPTNTGANPPPPPMPPNVRSL